MSARMILGQVKVKKGSLAQHNMRVLNNMKVLLVHLFRRFSCHQKSAEFARFGSSPTRFVRPKDFFPCDKI